MFAKILYDMMSKNVKFDAEFESVEKKCEKSPKRILGLKLLHRVIEVKISIFRSLVGW
jgi:hypothetical protein